MSDDPTYQLEAVTRTYGDGSTLVTALDALDLTIRSGEFVAILGPSGSGKTTLLQVLGALDRPSAGTVRFEGRHLDGLGDAALADLRLSAIGFVFQQFNLIPTLTAAGNVEAVLAPLRMNGVNRTGNLDTKSGEMVIDLLGSLHRDLEITVILVTHDQWVAERADRVLSLADGRLVGDTTQAGGR
jgi:ABC-type lipoprotein export system ATPase subunit